MLTWPWIAFLKSKNNQKKRALIKEAGKQTRFTILDVAPSTETMKLNINNNKEKRIEEMI